MIENITSEFLNEIELPKKLNKNYLILVPPAIMNFESQYRFPVGIALVSAALKASGRNVFSANLAYKENIEEYIINIIKENKIDVVYTGGLCVQFSDIKQICDIVKNYNPSIIMGVGGGIITGSPEVSMQALENADVGMIGEGEITINALSYAIETKGDWDSVDGIIYKKDGDWKRTSKRAEIQNLDIVPFPDYEGLEFQEMMDKPYCEPPMIPGQRNATIVAGRSCKFRCTFCFHPSGSRYRKRGLDNIFKEIDWLIHTFKIDAIVFQDEMFVDKENEILEFCQRIEPYHIKWQMQTRIDTVNEEILRRCREAGCFHVGLGLESADNRVLKSMHKNITVEQYEKVADIAQKVGMNIESNLIFGDICEDEETINNSLNWWKDHPQYDIKLGWIRVYPGSDLYNYAVKNGYIVDEVSFLTEGCPQINISKLTDESYWRWVDEVYLLATKSRNEKVKESVKLTKTTDTTIDLHYKCVNCGMETEFKEAYSMFKDITYQCPYCGEHIGISPIDYVDVEFAKTKIQKILKGKVGIWAAVGHAIAPVFDKFPELNAHNVWLIDKNATGMVKLCGKIVYQPDIIEKNGIDTIICPNIEGTYQQIKEECKKINCVKHFYHISDLLVEKV